MQDLVVTPTQPALQFLAGLDSVDANIGDTIPVPFSFTLTADGQAVTFQLRLAVIEGGGVVSVDSTNRLIVRARGVARLEARPLSTALATDTLRAMVTLRGVVPRLGVRSTPEDTATALHDTLQLLAVALTQAGDTIRNVPIAWDTAAGATGGIARLLDATTGRVEAEGNGSTEFVASVDNATVNRRVRVQQEAARVVAPDTVRLIALTQTQLLAAQVLDRRGNLIAGLTPSWRRVVPDTAASVTAAGLVTAQYNGSARLEATYQGKADTTVVVVAQLPRQIRADSGNNQTGTVGQPLAALLVAQALDSLGQPYRVGGASVAFTVRTGGGKVAGKDADTVLSDLNGRARTTFTLGPAAGSHTVEVRVLGTSSTVTFAATGRPGPPARLDITVEPRDVVAGGSIAPAVQVTVRDALGNRVDTAHTVIAAAIDTGTAGATLSGTTSVAADTGIARFILLSIDKAGARYRLRFSATGLAGDTSAVFAVTPDAASRLAFLAQPSNTSAGQAIAPPIEIEVQDALANRVASSADVTLDIATVPVGGSTTLNGTRIVTASNGVAVFSNVIIAGAATGYALRASSPGLTSVTSVLFNVTAVVGPPATVAKVSGDNQGGIVGARLAQPFVVVVRDATGNPVIGDSVIFKVTAGGGTFDGVDSIIVVTGATGQASATLTLGSSEGTNTATARSTKLATQPMTFTASATPPDLRLAFVTQPSNATGGSAISPAVQVAVQDLSGVTQTTATTNITLSLTSGTGTPGASVRGTVTVGAVNGVATFANVNVDRAGTGYTVTASATGVQSATSAAFDIAVGAAAQLAFFTVPTNGVAGASLGSIQVEVQDLGGNRVTSSNAQVTMAIAASTGTANANLRDTRTVNASAGLAAFATLSIDSAGTGYRLTATASGLATTTSPTFDIAPAPAARLAVTSQPSSAVAGASLGTVVVAVRDSLGNLVTTANTPVTLALSGGTAGANLRGTRTVNPVGGLATFTGLSVDSAGTGYTLAASAPGLVGATSAQFTVTVGPAARLRFLVQPAATAPLVAITPAVTVAVQDSMGNTVTTSSATVAVAFAGTPGVTLGGTTSVNAAAGLATFGNLTVSGAATGLRLVATSDVLRPDTSAAFDVTSAPINRLSFSAEPSSVTAGELFSVTVRIVDASNNTVTTATDSISLAFQAGTGTAGAHLLGVVSKRASAGVAEFTGLRVDSAGTGYRIIATSSLLTPDTSQVFNVAAGAARRLAFTVQPTSRTAGQVFSPALQVAVRDSVDNTVTSYSSAVTLAIQAGTGAAGATLAGTTSVTPANGVATYTDVSIAAAGTGYRLVASSGSLVPDTSVAFSVAVGAVASVVVTPAGETIATAGGTQTFHVEARDANGNVISGKTITWASLNPNVATINSSTGVATAVASGQVTVSATVDGVTGYGVVTVAIPGATPVNLWAAIQSPTSSGLNAVWGTSGSNVLAVGDDGAVVRYNGTSWASMTSATTSTFAGALWGSSGSDVFAVGNSGTIVRFNGTNWTAMSSGTSQNLGAVWGTAPNDVYAVGAGGTILRYNGSAWTGMTSGTTRVLSNVWGTSSTNIYAVGELGTILRYDGTSWNAMTSGTSVSLSGIWGTGSADVYAVGDGGTILRYNGTSWTAMISGTTQNLHRVWGTSSSDVYAVGPNGTILRYDGTSWTAQSSGTNSTLNSVWGTGGGDVFPVGQFGTILRGYRGATVVVTPASPIITSLTGTQQLTAAARDAANNVISGLTNSSYTWTSRSPSIATVSGTGLVTAVAEGTARIVAVAPGGAADSTTARVAVPTTVIVTPAGASLSGAGATEQFTADVRDGLNQSIPGLAVTWASLNPNVATMNSSTGVATAVASGQVTISATAAGVSGYALLTVAIPSAAPINLLASMTSGTTNNLGGVWGTSDFNLYAAGNGGTILRFDGGSWAAAASGTTEHLGSVWGTTPSSIFVGGNGGTILRFDGTSWSSMASGTTQGLGGGMYATSPNDIFAVGDFGTIRRWDGTSWTSISSGTSNHLMGTWGTSSTNVFVAGWNGTIRHWDGASLTVRASGTTQHLRGMWGTSPTNAFVVGGGGTILRYDGTTWTPLVTGTTQDLYGVSGTSSSDVYAVGNGGTILRYDGTTWTALASGTTVHLSRAWLSLGGHLWVVGDNGTILRGFAGATVTVTPASPTLSAIGGTQQMTATARDASNNTISGVTFTWSSSNTAVATVNSSGLVTAVASGSATITATAPGGAANSATVSVNVASRITAGLSFSCGLTTGGSAYCWGYNAFGQLGNGTTTRSTSPVAVSGGLSFQSISADAFHACGMTTSGSAYCWGDNRDGELGNNTTINSSTPVAVSDGLTFMAITAGNTHTCGLTVAGKAYCWGGNFEGELGNGTMTNSSSPVAVLGGLTFREISAGRHTCGLTTGASVYCWGFNGDGQLGSGTTTSSSTPVLVSGGLLFQSISAGQVHTCGLTTGASSYCWGLNGDGQLGNGTTTSSSTPVAVSGGLTFRSISAYTDSDTCALEASGSAYCWGRNDVGQLGNGTSTASSIPVVVSGGLTLTTLDAGFYHNCALATGGSAYCWGQNSQGEIGDGTLETRLTPVAVLGGIIFGSPPASSSWRSISVGRSSSR